MAPVDEVARDPKAEGPNVCVECGGTGRVGHETCEPCAGTGRLEEPLGGP
jgi:DnaJ-class molecular chaperone